MDLNQKKMGLDIKSEFTYLVIHQQKFDLPGSPWFDMSLQYETNNLKIAKEARMICEQRVKEKSIPDVVDQVIIRINTATKKGDKILMKLKPKEEEDE